MVQPQEPHERTSLIAPSTRNAHPQTLQSASQDESGSADTDAGNGVYDSSETVAAPKAAAGIAGVISVLLLGMFVHRYSAA